jgi:hypothetical protein
LFRKKCRCNQIAEAGLCVGKNKSVVVVFASSFAEIVRFFCCVVCLFLLDGTCGVEATGEKISFKNCIFWGLESGFSLRL